MRLRRAHRGVAAERPGAAGTVSAAEAPRGSLTRRNCSVAVRPMMSLALAVSCTPGSCTTTRSAALLLDHRLGHAELVDAVVQRVMFC
jgi:hypothetical protein